MKGVDEAERLLAWCQEEWDSVPLTLLHLLIAARCLCLEGEYFRQVADKVADLVDKLDALETYDA